jgi:SAM-dependent methyltransferase
MTDLAALLGPIDIYLLDQVLRGRIRPGMSIVDAGCGGGRNLVYFLNEGYDVSGLDPDPRAVESVRALAARLRPELADALAARFRAEPVEASTFPEGAFEVVVSSAVLHFARDDAQFLAMLRGSWRLLAPGGLFFCRLASDIGMEGKFRSLGGRRFLLLDGSERYLVDEAMLAALARELGGTPEDPLKTTVVSGLRCMTTWVLRRS